MKNEIVWVFRSFGWKAGLRYLLGILYLRLKRALRKEKVVHFEDLTDAQAEEMAVMFGISKWDNRDHLNRIWYKHKREMN